MTEKKFKIDDFFKLSKPEQKEIFKVMYNSWGGPKDPIKPRRKKKRGGKV
tara:strand:- start:5058 stop:5207 length:150 start_codon:yes stop_codon:yes gene_type:complete